ncbi:MAG: glycosyltransferase [Lachnospiraceae bacterium]|nr:glycosyltransferase [Lachnospiraceae bacterium]
MENESKKPVVSLLMTTMNCRLALENTLEGVRRQDYPLIEVVIKDAGSTDGTVEVIRDFEEELKRDDRGWTLVWESAPDKGLYDGMNRAVAMASGDILGVCNDRLTGSGVISLMVDTMMKENAQAVHADLVYMDGDVCKRLWHAGEGTIESGWMPAHPTLYVRREVYEKFGDYDITMKSSSDYDWMIRIIRNGHIKPVYIPKVLVSMYWGGTSNNGFVGYPRNIMEAWLALRKNGVPFPTAVIALRILRTIRQYILAGKWQKRRNRYCC